MVVLDIVVIINCISVAQFTVHARGQGIIALQNVKNPALWLAIRGGQLTTVMTI